MILVLKQDYERTTYVKIQCKRILFLFINFSDFILILSFIRPYVHYTVDGFVTQHEIETNTKRSTTTEMAEKAKSPVSKLWSESVTSM